LHGRLQSGWVSNLTLPERRSLSTPHGISSWRPGPSDRPTNVIRVRQRGQQGRLIGIMATTSASWSVISKTLCHRKGCCPVPDSGASNLKPSTPCLNTTNCVPIACRIIAERLAEHWRTSAYLAGLRRTAYQSTAASSAAPLHLIADVTKIVRKQNYGDPGSVNQVVQHEYPFIKKLDSCPGNNLSVPPFSFGQLRED
jgi:hypothetical protein